MKISSPLSNDSLSMFKSRYSKKTDSQKEIPKKVGEERIQAEEELLSPSQKDLSYSKNKKPSNFSPSPQKQTEENSISNCFDISRFANPRSKRKNEDQETQSNKKKTNHSQDD